MKNMNNYEAPKAEMIELYADKAFMTGAAPTDPSDPGMPDTSGNY